jgi:hypothetical protein
VIVKEDVEPARGSLGGFDPQPELCAWAAAASARVETIGDVHILHLCGSERMSQFPGSLLLVCLLMIAKQSLLEKT